VAFFVRSHPRLGYTHATIGPERRRLSASGQWHRDLGVRQEDLPLESPVFLRRLGPLHWAFSFGRMAAPHPRILFIFLAGPSG